MVRTNKHLFSAAILIACSFAFDAKSQIFLCPGDTVCLTLGNYYGNIQWQISADNVNWTDVSGAVTDTSCIIASDSSYYRAVITEGSCDPYYSDTSYVVLSHLAADAGLDTIVCIDSVQIGGNPSAFNGIPPYTYLWNPPAGLSDPAAANPMAFPPSPTAYVLSVTDSIGCMATDTVFVDTGLVIAFHDDFNGNTLGSTVAYPYGDPNPCGYPNCVNFSNNGNEEVMNFCCYDEGEIRYTLNLPAANYTITMVWHSGADPFQFNGANETNFDDQYGATTMTPKRILVIDGSLVWELPGKLTNYSGTEVINYTGAISNLYIGMGTSGTNTQYYSYFDDLLINVCP